MLPTTLPRLRCPARTGTAAKTKGRCASPLYLSETRKEKAGDVLTGTLTCTKCKAAFPILSGVALLVSNVEEYIHFHVKGLSALVDEADIPDEYLETYLLAKGEIQTGHAEEDLESKRINALYFMNHYLKAGKTPWWRPKTGPYSREVDRLVRNFWDNGPFAKIAQWTKSQKKKTVIEVGCGVGGLAQSLGTAMESYLGVDHAFASIALARHVYVNAPYSLPVAFPQDLYQGPLTGKTTLPKLRLPKGSVDFVVGEMENLPVADGQFDLCVALNTIDMIENPRLLPKLQWDLLKEGGTAIQSGPYIWHEGVVKALRESLPKKIQSSSAAVEHLYEAVGFEIFKKIDHLPWLFLKHFRQIEMYSVHLFAARKNEKI